MPMPVTPEEEEILGYESYMARQRIEQWEEKKVCPLEEPSDLDETEGLAEAMWWCAVLFVVILAGAVLLTN